MSRDNSGSLSRNKRKEKPTHADMKGKATIDGVEYWISGWTKENDDGKWLSLAFERKEGGERAPGPKRVKHDDGPDSDIPFN